MATAKKKKPSAKRSVKYAAKAQPARATAAAPNWVAKSAAEWQKGAQDWAKESAKLYHMPFSQKEVDAAARQAAETVKSATENMTKMSNEMMQQLFSQQAKSSQPQFDPSQWFKQWQHHLPQMPQMPGFDPSSMQEKLAAFARESSEQLSRIGQGSNRAAAEAVELSQENIETLTEVTNIAVTIAKELMAEAIGYMNRQFAQNVELSKQVLSCRTLNDMFDLATRITKSNLDAFFSESVKISEKLFQCANDVSEPLNERMSETTERMSRAMSA